MRQRNRFAKNLSAGMAVILACMLMASCGLPYKASKVAKEGTKLYEAGDEAGAEARFKEALAENADDPYAHHYLGEIYAKQGKYADAAKEYAAVLKTAPQNVNVNYLAGENFYKAGEDENALQYLKVVDGLKPKLNSTQLYLGNMLYKKDDFDGALPHMQMAFDLDGKNAEAGALLGELLYRAKKPQEAKKILTKALKLKADMGGARYWLGRVGVDENAPAAFEGDLKEAVRLGSHVPESNFHLGAYYFKKGDPGGAKPFLLESLNKASETEKPTGVEYLAEAYYELGIISYGEKDLAKAEQYLTKNVMLDAKNHDSHYHLGLINHENGKMEKAQKEFETALSLRADYKQSHYYLGLIHFGRKDFQKAKGSFLADVKVEPGNFDSHYHLGIIYYYTDKNLELAKGSYGKAAELKPEHVDSHYHLGLINYGQKSTEEAFKEFTRTTELDKNHEDAHYHLGLINDGAKRFEPAKAEYLETIRINAKHNRASYLVGVIYDNEGSKDPAEKYLLAGAKIDDKIADAHYRLGMINFDIRRNMVKAEVFFTTAVTLEPGHIDSHYHLGLICQSSGRVPQAEKEFLTVVSLKADHEMAHYYLGRIYYDRKDYPGSKAQFAAVVKVNPNSYDAHFHLGMIGYIEKQYKPSFESFTKTVGIFPTHATAHFFLGLIHNIDGRKPEAEAEFKTATDIDPNMSEPHYYFGLMKFERGDLDGAKLEFEKLLALNPRHAQGNYRLGLIHYEKKAYDKSEMYMKMAVQYDAGITDAHYHLGMIYFMGNKLGDSKKSFLTAVSQAPVHPDANYHLGLINFEQKLFPDSRKHFGVVVNMPEYAVDANYHLGVMDYLDKKYAQSEAEFKKVVQAESKHKMAHFYLGRLYYDTKAWLKSRDSYMKALAVEPEQPMFKYNLALTYIKLPHYFEARDNLMDVLKKEPNNTLAKAELLDLERIIADSVAGTGKGALATKRTIAVGNFTSNAKVTDYKWLEVGIAESLTTDLSGLSGLTLVERGNLEKVMREKKLEATGMTTESVSSVGREVGAEAIIIGGYQVAGPKGEEELRVDGRLVSVQDGSILKSESSRGKIGDLYNMERTLALALLADYVFISATEQDAFLKGKASDLNALENWSKGKSLALLGNSDAAAAYYKKALETDPQYSAALRDLKLSQKDLGKTDTLAIMAFKNATGKADYDWLSMGIAESLTTDLKKLTGIYLVERLEIEKALREMKLAEAGLVDETKAPQLGKMVGAGIVAVGSYQVFGTKIRIDMRMVEVETSQILLTEKVDGEMDKIFEAEEKLAMKIAQTLNRSLSPEEVAKLKDKPDLESFKKYIMAQASLTLAEQKQEGGTKVKAVAITPFENASGNKEYDWLKEGIPGSLTTDLKSMGKLSLIERAQVDKALSEMKLGKAGLVDEKSAPKLGRATGADTVISGSYQISGENIRIDARLVRVGSGEVLRASNASGELKDVFNVEKTLAYKLLDAMGVDVAAGAGEKGEARSIPSATVSSVIVPGAGQILVNKEATKGFVMLGVEGALVVGALAMMSDASAKNDKYVQSGGTDESAYSSSTQSYNTGVMMIGGMAALAVYSGVDAWYVARTHNMKLSVVAPVPGKAEEKKSEAAAGLKFSLIPTGNGVVAGVGF